MGVLDDIRENYPTLAFLINDPQVGPLLRNAVDPSRAFSPQKFQAKLYQTNWFRKQSQSMREYDILRHTDPGTFGSNVASYRTSVAQTAARLGVRLSQAQITWLAHDAYRRGMEQDDPRIAYGVSRLRTSRNDTAGAIRTATIGARSLSYGQYYTSMSNREAHSWGDKIARGLRTMDDLQADLQRRAASKYPHLAAQLNAGQTMDQIFAGHKAIIAEELELAPESIDLARSRWSKVTGIYDAKQKQHRPMTLYETKVMAREDPRFWRTQHGQQEDAQMASFMAQTFGKRA